MLVTFFEDENDLPESQSQGLRSVENNCENMSARKTPVFLRNFDEIYCLRTSRQHKRHSISAKHSEPINAPYGEVANVNRTNRLRYPECFNAQLCNTSKISKETENKQKNPCLTRNKGS